MEEERQSDRWQDLEDYIFSFGDPPGESER